MVHAFLIRRGVQIVLALVPVLVLALFMGTLVLLAGGTGGSAAAACGGIAAPALVGSAATSASVPGFTQTQVANAAVIMNVASSLGLPKQAQYIGVMTALGESTLGADATAMVPNNDKDSGLFQLRVKIGWHADGKTEAENQTIVADPTYATKVFFQGHTVGVDGGENPRGYHIPGLVDIAGWQTMDPVQAAHAVQGNAASTNHVYTNALPEARTLVDALSSSTTTPAQPPLSTTSATATTGSGLPTQVAGLPAWWTQDGRGAERMTNAAAIVSVGKSKNVPARGIVIALATAAQESKLLNLDYGDRDSLGLFQQRPSQGWGTPEQVRDPVYASTKFYEGLLAVSGWETMPLTQAAQAVQRSGFPDAYAQWEPMAAVLAAALDATSPTAPGLGTGTNCALSATNATFNGTGPPPGGWAPESCSLTDPTGTGGCVTPRTDALAKQLMAQGYSVSCWDAHAWNPKSDHPKGKGCDVTMGSLGTFAKGADKAKGDALFTTLQQQSGPLGVKYLIWYGQYWSAKTNTTRPYTGGGVYNPNDATGGHYDHVHVSMY